MNKKQFINKEIINKNNQKGIVVSFDNDYIVIRYYNNNEEKTYNPDIAFSKKYLSFLDSTLNTIIEQDLYNKKQLRIKKEEMFKRKLKKLKERYQKLSNKNKILKSLFGSDFKYPPIVEFEEKYKKYIFD